jgi:Mrp family chromosome partitioning ATPase
MEAVREAQVMAGLTDSYSPRLRISRPAGGDLPSPMTGAMGARAFKSIKGGAGTAQPQQRPLCIGVTSVDYQDGKSTFAMALASCLAQDFAAEVLLVDADFETHSVGREYGLEGRPGFSDVLMGAAGLQQVAYRYRDAPLNVITSGTQQVDSSRLARSERVASSIEEMRTLGAFTVLDLPAGLRTSNAAVVGSKCDGVIIVARAGRTTKADLARLLRLFQDVNVIGVVINRQHTSVPALAERLLGLPA